MSVKQMSLVWDLDLPPNKRLVLLAYADHADDDGDNVYPSLPRVAHKTGYSVNQVRRISRELVTDGLMELVERGDGRGNTHRYRLTLEKGTVLPSFKSQRETAERVPNENKRVPSQHKRVPPVVPEPSITVSKEPSSSRRGAKAPPEAPPEDKESSKPTNWFTVFCERLKEVGLCPTPEDREYGAKHFKQCVQTERANEREMRRVVARMVNWRLEGKGYSPQRALNDIRGVTSIQDYRQGLPGNKPKTQDASTPSPPTSVVEALRAHKDFKHLAYLAERWDFTSDTPPPWPVLKELGGTDEERGRYLQRIQSVARKAKRAAPSSAGASGKEVS